MVPPFGTINARLMDTQLSKAIAAAQVALKANNAINVEGTWYGVRHLFTPNHWRKREVELVSFDVVGEDDCGNEFLVGKDNEVLFWDHETSDIARLSDSVPAFLASLIKGPEVHLKPGQVKSVWIKPGFKPRFE